MNDYQETQSHSGNFIKECPKWHGGSHNLTRRKDGWLECDGCLALYRGMFSTGQNQEKLSQPAGQPGRSI